MENKTIILDGIEYNLVPKESNNYLTGHKNSGLKVGDMVKVIKKADDYEAGWGCNWDSIKNNYVGKILKITSDEGVDGFALNNQWHFPYFVLEKVEEPIEPKIETYNDILDILKPNYLILSHGDVVIMSFEIGSSYDQYISEEKAQSAVARLKLENVAHYLNEVKYKDKNWEPQYWSICLLDMEVKTEFCSFSYLDGNIKFKTKEIALEAIQILGKETIKLVLK